MIYPSHLLVPDIFADDTTIGTSSHSIDTLLETLTTDLQNVSHLVILSAGMLILITLLKSVIPIYSYC